MPAHRSRTLEWRRCLRQVQERNGSLEIAVAHSSIAAAGQPAPTQHLVWRVRLLSVGESEIVVEQPAALGQTLQIDRGIELLAILSIGQNRWIFRTRNMGASTFGIERRSIPVLRLSMPEAVERCQRRNHYRVETAAPRTPTTGGLTLPKAEVWALLDPKSVLVAERAYEIQFEIDMGRVPSAADAAAPFDYEAIMPEVGPKFMGELLNLGGGGVGLRVLPDDASTLGHHKLFWMRIALPPALNTPICATAKLVHTHMESTHDVYAGMAFDFSFNPSHQRFVVDQICRYIALQQRAQLQQIAPPDAKRRTA